MTDQWLVRKLLEQDKKIEALSRGGTGVGHTSIAPGEALTVISEDGEVVLGAGGVDYVDGPTPATPSAPTLKLGFGTIEVTWDGSFAAGEDENGIPLVAPIDFDVAEVHCSTDPLEEEWGDDTRRGQIKTREGGTITVGGFDVDDEVFVCLIALAKTGKRSAPSATASLVIEGLDFSQLFNELDAANATIKNAGEILVTEQGTLDEKLSEVDGTLNDLGQDLQAVEDAQAQLGTDLTEVMTSVDGKNAITWNPSAPSAVSNPGKAVGDMWYRTSGNNIIGFWKWDGTDWVTQLLDKTTIPLIDIGAGTFGSLTGARLVAGSVAASSIAVGDFSNLATIDPVRNVNVTRPATWATVKDGDYIKPAPGTQMQYLMFKDRTNTVPFGPGDSLRVKFTMNSPDAFQVRAYMWGYPQLEDGANGGLEAANSPVVNISSGVFEYTTVIPVPLSFGATTILKSWVLGLRDVANASMHGAGVRDVSVYRMTGNTLIQDGGITTPKLAADVLNVGNLKAGTAAIQEAVVNKLWAEAVVAKMVTATEFIGENAILTGAVTAPKITASEELWAKIGEFVKIRAEQIEADAIDGMVIRGATMLTPFLKLGESVEITEAYGIRQFGPDGELTVNLPSDGSQASFAGDVRAKSLTTTGLMSVQGSASVASGASMALESGVTPPVSPPTVTPYVPITEFPDLADNENAVGLAWDGTHFWRAVDNSENGAADRMERVDVDGNLVSSFDYLFWARNGITVIGSEIFALGIQEGSLRDSSKRFVYVYDFTGTFKRKWEYKEYGSGTYQPGIGTDGTNLYIAQCWANGDLTWRVFNKTSGAKIGSNINANAKIGADIVDISVGAFDYGATRVVVTSGRSTGGVDIYSTSGVRVDYGGWYAAAKQQVRGTAWNGTRFCHLLPTGNIATMSTTKYPNGSPGEETNDWWAACGWSSGTYSTQMGPRQRFTMMRRAGYKVAAGTVPSNVSAVDIYVAQGDNPGRTGFLKVTQTGASGVGAIHDFGWPMGAPNPPAVGTFPNATPGVIRSVSNTFEVKGDGSGRWGPLTFNPDGTMTSSQIPEWVPITSFKSGFSAQTWGDVPSYRIWPDGKVEWRGVIAGKMPIPESKSVFTIPAAARPGRPKNKVAAASGVGVMRVEFGPNSAPTDFYVYPDMVGGSRTWVSIDELFYYLP